jgi:hypothetical protein
MVELKSQDLEKAFRVIKVNAAKKPLS